MALWEFSLICDDGTVIEQTVVAEGQDEAAAAGAAVVLIGDHAGVRLSRPGGMASPEVETRWRDVLGETLPALVSNAGRMARYARGIAG